jgi:high-affinity nickel-transport protein
VMRRAYAWQPGRRRVGHLYGAAMTGLSVIAAVVIAITQLAGVLVADLGLGGPLRWVASIGIEDLGFVLTGMLLATWAAVLLITRQQQRAERQ